MEYVIVYFLVGLVINAYMVLQDWDSVVASFEVGGRELAETILGLIVAVIAWPIFLFWVFKIYRR